MKVTTRIFCLFLIFIIYGATVGVQSLIPPECQEICAHCNDPTYSIHQCLAEIYASEYYICRDCYPGFLDLCGDPAVHDGCKEPLKCIGDAAFKTCIFGTEYVEDPVIPSNCATVCEHCMNPLYPEELCIQEILDQPGDSCYDCYLGTIWQCNTGDECLAPLNCVVGLLGACFPPCPNLDCKGVVCTPCIHGVLVFDECKCCPDCQQCIYNDQCPLNHCCYNGICEPAEEKCDDVDCSLLGYTLDQCNHIQCTCCEYTCPSCRDNSHCPLNHCCNNGVCEPAVYQCVDADCSLLGYTIDQCNNIQCSCCGYTCTSVCITYHECPSRHSCFNGECIPCPPCPFWAVCGGCPPGTITKLVDKECSCCNHECVPVAATNIGGIGIGAGPGRGTVGVL